MLHADSQKFNFCHVSADMLLTETRADCAVCLLVEILQSGSLVVCVVVQPDADLSFRPESYEGSFKLIMMFNVGNTLTLCGKMNYKEIVKV